jgi:hypothetical protein
MNDGQTAPKVADPWSATVQRICKKYPDIWVFMFAQVKKDAIKKDILHRQDIRFGSEFIDRCDVFLSLNKKLQPDSSYWDEKKDDKKEAVEENRDVILYLDKNRLTDVPAGRGWKIYHSRTGNFTEKPDEELLGIVKPKLKNSNELQIESISTIDANGIHKNEELNQDNLFENFL